MEVMNLSYVYKTNSTGNQIKRDMDEGYWGKGQCRCELQRQKRMENLCKCTKDWNTITMEVKLSEVSLSQD